MILASLTPSFTMAIVIKDSFQVDVEIGRWFTQFSHKLSHLALKLGAPKKGLKEVKRSLGSFLGDPLDPIPKDPCTSFGYLGPERGIAPPHPQLGA